jgi:recombination protein RecT
MSRVQTDSKGQIQRAAPEQGGKLLEFIADHQRDLAQVLPRHLTPERMARLAISAVRSTRGLAECTLRSFASSILACSTLGLEPNTPLGHAYLIPRKIKGTPTCTLIIGYQGLVELMYRSGAVSSVKAEPVFEGDDFEYEKGLNPKLRHIPRGEDDPSKLTHVYTVVRWRDGGEPVWDVLTRSQIERRRSRGGGGDAFSPWRTDYVAMALKTGVRAIARWVPSSTEKPALQQAIAYEESVERGAPRAAIAALGDEPQAILESHGVDMGEDAADEDGVLSERTRTREPGEDE